MTEKGKQSPPAPPPAAVDRVDGIPDRAARRPAWIYVLLAAIFLGWAAFLLYCHLWGNP